MFYRHLHEAGCPCATHGEEAPVSHPDNIAALKARVAELEQDLDGLKTQVTILQASDRAYASASAENLAQRLILSGQLATVTAERDAAIETGRENAVRYADHEARLTAERGQWHADASAHLLALCEKQAES